MFLSTFIVNVSIFCRFLIKILYIHEKDRTSQNHPHQKNFIVFYGISYDDEATRGLEHEERKKNWGELQ